MLLKNIHDIFNAVPADPLGGFLFFFVRLRQMTPIQNDVPRHSIEKNKLDMGMFPHRRPYCVLQMLLKFFILSPLSLLLL